MLKTRLWQALIDGFFASLYHFNFNVTSQTSHNLRIYTVKCHDSQWWLVHRNKRHLVTQCTEALGVMKTPDITLPRIQRNLWMDPHGDGATRATPIGWLVWALYSPNSPILWQLHHARWNYSIEPKMFLWILLPSQVKITCVSNRFSWADG